MITDKDLWEESSLKDALVELVRESHMRKILMVVLQGRFGPLDADITVVVSKADEEYMLAIAKHAGTDTREQLRERLGLPPAP